MNAAKPILLVTLFFCAGNAFAQQQGKESDEEPAAIVELGGAAAHGLTGEGASFGPTVAVEVTPIENRLELEAGVTALFRRTPQNGVPIFFSKSLGRSRKRRSLWSASGRSGFTRGNLA